MNTATAPKSVFRRIVSKYFFHQIQFSYFCYIYMEIENISIQYDNDWVNLLVPQKKFV